MERVLYIKRIPGPDFLQIGDWRLAAENSNTFTVAHIGGQVHGPLERVQSVLRSLKPETRRRSIAFAVLQGQGL